MSEWKLVTEEEPPLYQNVLLAFVEHWNQVVGFRTNRGEYWETSAHDHNSRIQAPGPTWWMEIGEVPHRSTRPSSVEAVEKALAWSSRRAG